jgi:hypothetical protein
LNLLSRRNEQLVIVPQVLFEFWAVSTRTAGAMNGLGMSVENAGLWIAFFRRRFTLLPDKADLPDRWLELVRSRKIRGFKCHDARLVAAMMVYGMTRLLTLNAGDFEDMGIDLLSPEALASTT